jgi:hypothetical protein
MSIIQDALKKVGNPGDSKTRPDRSHASKKITRPAVYILIIFVVLAYFGLKQFFHAASGQSSGVNYTSLLQSIYKPVSSADAMTAEPAQAAAAKAKRRGFPDYILSGVMQLVDGPRAIINNVMVGVGDVVNGAKVMKIDKNGVILKKKDSEIALGME